MSEPSAAAQRIHERIYLPTASLESVWVDLRKMIDEELRPEREAADRYIDCLLKYDKDAPITLQAQKQYEAAREGGGA